MRLDLKNLFETEGESLSFQYELDLSGIEISGVHPITTPVSVRGRAQNTAQTVNLTLRATYNLTLPCDRCAEEMQQHYDQTFTHRVVLQLKGQEAEDCVQATNGKLETDELLQADILLSLPTKFLCKDDCKGLCAACGANQNSGGCNCNRRQTDPRLEVLRRLIDSVDFE